MKKSNEKTLKEVLHQMIETYKLKSRLHQSKIKMVWEDAMGSGIAKYTTDMTAEKSVIVLQWTHMFCIMKYLDYFY